MSLDDRLRSGSLSRRDFLKLLGVASASVVAAACDSVSSPPPSGTTEPCPFNPAVEYAQGEGLLPGYDVAGFGSACVWDPTSDSGRDPASFLTPHTIAMLHWMDEISRDPFYDVDQVQSLVTRFGEGVIDPESGQRVTRDVGVVNEDEYLASRDFYEQAKRMHEWAVENEHRAESIKPIHYRRFDAWSVKAVQWPLPEEFQLPIRDSRIEDTGLEPNRGLAGFTPLNWGVDKIGTDDYEPENFMGLEGKLTGNDGWLECNTNVENNPRATQNFVPDNQIVRDELGGDLPIRSMFYSKGFVTRVFVGGAGESWVDQTIEVRNGISATLVDLGPDGTVLTRYAHVSGPGGSMENPPEEGSVIGPGEYFAWLNSQRPFILGDFQQYVDQSVDVPGVVAPFDTRGEKMVDIYYLGAGPGKTFGLNDPRLNRFETGANYARAIGNRSAFSPCTVKDGEYVHEPR